MLEEEESWANIWVSQLGNGLVSTTGEVDDLRNWFILTWGRKSSVKWSSLQIKHGYRGFHFSSEDEFVCLYCGKVSFFFLPLPFFLIPGCYWDLPLSYETTFISEVEAVGGWDGGFCAGAVSAIPDGLLVECKLVEPIVPLVAWDSLPSGGGTWRVRYLIIECSQLGIN